MKLAIRFMLLALGLFTWAGCATHKVITTHDEFDGTTKHRMYFNALGCAGLLAPTIQLKAQRFDQKDGAISYSLIVEYSGKNWLFIAPGESLVFKIDGKRKAFSGEGSADHRHVGGLAGVSETAWYHEVKLEDLRELANAQEVKIKIEGKNTYVTRCFKDYSFKSFQNFVANFGREGDKR